MLIKQFARYFSILILHPFAAADYHSIVMLHIFHLFCKRDAIPRLAHFEPDFLSNIFWEFFKLNLKSFSFCSLLFGLGALITQTFLQFLILILFFRYFLLRLFDELIELIDRNVLLTDYCLFIFDLFFEIFLGVKESLLHLDKIILLGFQFIL